MKEVVIKYKDTKTLEILKSLAKYFDFFILPKKKTSISGGKNDYDYINGVAIQFGDRSIDIAQLNSIFTGKNIDAKKLRTEAWRRKK